MSFAAASRYAGRREVKRVPQSSRSGSAPVKTQTPAGPRRRAGSGGAAGWARHFEGWQPAVVALFIAGSTAALAVPRPVDPAEVPLPLADPRALARALEADEALAAALDPGAGRPARELDLDVRELGAAVREFGLADAGPDRKDDALVAARRRLSTALGPALARGAEDVLALRAWQQRAFIRAVRRWEVSGEESEDLRALGGDFLGLLRKSRWVEAGAADAGVRRVALDGAALAVLFKKRWNKVVGVQGPPFDPTLDEERALVRFLLASPPHEAAGRRADDYRLKKIGEIAALDPSYPRHLARGVVLYRLGKYADAADAFRLHLDTSPEGAYTLRAQNYLRAALGRARGEDL
jgi:hypothetical protein